MFSSLLALEAKKTFDEDGNPLEKTFITYREAEEWLELKGLGEKDILQKLRNIVLSYLAITVAKVENGAPSEYEELQSLNIEATREAVELLNAIHVAEEKQKG